MLKIPITTIERVATTTYVDMKVTKEIELSNYTNDYDNHFQDLINWMLSLKFVASSCLHSNFKEFPGYKQGGRNACNLQSIKLLERFNSRYTFQVTWKSFNNKAIVILEDENKS